MSVPAKDIVVRIFVEGIADQVFLYDTIKQWYQFDGERKAFLLKIRESQFIEIKKAGDKNDSGGKSYYLTDQGWEKQKAQFAFPGTKLIIIDADESHAHTMAGLKQTIDIPDFPFETHVYLWPNNSESGELEALLEFIINPANQSILNCWSAFEDCIQKIPNKDLTLPANKTKIYAYLETLLGETESEKAKIKERNRDYTNPDHWNLDPENKNLKPLKTFLDRHLLL